MTLHLFPFQKEAVERMVNILRTRKGVYNACEQGLGKTIQTIEACKRLGFTKILIICPKVVQLVWEKELKEHYSKATYEVIGYNFFSGGIVPKKYRKDIDGDAEHNRKAALARVRAKKEEKLIAAVAEVTRDCLVLDECHYVKSTTSNRMKNILKKVWPKVPNRICLSGTPLTQCITDVWTLFSRLAPEHFPEYWKFVYRYGHVEKTPYGDKVTGVDNAEELSKIIRSTFFIRYRKSEVLKDLPDKIWTQITLPKSYAVKLTPEEYAEHQKYLVKVKESFSRNTPVRAVPPKAVATFRREQGIKKAPAVIEYCRNLLEQEIPIVIFAYHKEVIDLIRKELSAFNPVVITGATSSEDREKAVNDFQEGKTNLFIGNIKAAGVGITLTRASTAILAEVDWSPSDIAQAVDRLHRISQKYTVNIYFFIVEDSIDEKIVKVVTEKAKTFKAIIDHEA